MHQPTQLPSAPSQPLCKCMSTMSDAEYSAFLEKSSSQTQAPASVSSGQVKHADTVTTSSCHPALSLPEDRVYTTDADESFRPFSIPFSASKFDREAFSAAIQSATGKHVRSVEELSVKEWDARNEYGDVVSKVGEATGGIKGVKVFREEQRGSRVEYWIVGVEGKEMRGFVVTGVES